MANWLSHKALCLPCDTSNVLKRRLVQWYQRYGPWVSAVAIADAREISNRHTVEDLREYWATHTIAVDLVANGEVASYAELNLDRIRLLQHGGIVRYEIPTPISDEVLTPFVFRCYQSAWDAMPLASVCMIIPVSAQGDESVSIANLTGLFTALLSDEIRTPVVCRCAAFA